MSNQVIDALPAPRTISREREQHNVLATRNSWLRTAEALHGNRPDGTVGVAGMALRA